MHPPARSVGSRVNAMTIDVEDYFQVSAFEKHIAYEDWDGKELRVARNVDRILELLDRNQVKATFFVLGWIAQRLPGMVREIAGAGHEVASHGLRHTRVTQQEPGAFRDDVSSTKRILEDMVGQEVIGYRAATYSITEQNLWALDVLAETGHRYSSSIYPIKHDLYGIPAGAAFQVRRRRVEAHGIPITTVAMFGRTWPAGGGGYFRLFRTCCRVGRCGTSTTRSVSRPCSIFIRGDRPRSAARRRHRLEDAVSPLLEFGRARGPDRELAPRLQLGPARPGVRAPMSAAIAASGVRDGEPGRAELIVKRLGDAEHAAWDRFVLAAPDATFFHRAGWRRIVERLGGHRAHYLYASRGGEIVGVLPLAEMKAALRSFAVSTPFCVYGGAVAAPRRAPRVGTRHESSPTSCVDT
jgi:polysaccharide deacetylase family protein (PEP-CTERM system associated)